MSGQFSTRVSACFVGHFRGMASKTKMKGVKMMRRRVAMVVFLVVGLVVNISKLEKMDDEIGQLYSQFSVVAGTAN